MLKLDVKNNNINEANMKNCMDGMEEKEHHDFVPETQLMLELAKHTQGRLIRSVPNKGLEQNFSSTIQYDENVVPTFTATTVIVFGAPVANMGYISTLAATMVKVVGTLVAATTQHEEIRQMILPQRRYSLCYYDCSRELCFNSGCNNGKSIRYSSSNFGKSGMCSGDSMGSFGV